MAEPTERIAILLELQQQEFEKRAKSAGAAIDRLERKFNPLAAAEAKLEKQQKRFNAALEAGTIDAKQHANGMDLLQREYDQAADRAARLTNNVVAMNGKVAASTGFMDRNRSVFQQAGYQIGDFAVQVQGGQSAITAFTQQGSQMLGVFGAYGAIAGAVLAVGAPLIASFFSSGEAAEEFKDRAETLTSAVRAYSQAVENAQIPTEELEARYGSASEAARVFAQALTGINKAIALEALTASQAIDAIDVERLRSLIEFIDSVPENSQFISTKYMQSVEALQEEFGTTEVQARVLLDALDAFGNAKGPDQVVDAGERLLSVITDTFGPLESLTGEALNLAQQVQQVSDDAANLVGVIEDNTTSMLEFVTAAYEAGSAIASAFPNADTMLGKLKAMATAAWEYAGALGAAQMQSSEKGRSGAVDPTTVGGRPIDIQTAEAGEFLKNYKPPRPGGGGGGGRSSSGGGGREQTPLLSISDDELQRIQRQIDMLGKSKGEVAALTVKHKLLDEAKKRGIAITAELTEQIDAEAAEVGALAEQYDLARDKISAMEKIQGQWKDSVIDAAMGGADAMDSFRDAIKRAALEYALFGTGMFAGNSGGGSSGGGGLLGGFLSGIFGGIGANANGTPNWRGGLTSVNERGGEIMNLPQGTQIIPHDLSKRMIDKSGGGVTEIIIRNEPGTMVEIARNEAGAIVRQASSGIVRQSVGQAQASFRNSKQGWSP